MDLQGEYVCIAKNMIKGQERAVQSEPINVRVVGKIWLCWIVFNVN